MNSNTVIVGDNGHKYLPEIGLQPSIQSDFSANLGTHTHRLLSESSSVPLRRSHKKVDGVKPFWLSRSKFIQLRRYDFKTDGLVNLVLWYELTYFLSQLHKIMSVT